VFFYNLINFQYKATSPKIGLLNMEFIILIKLSILFWIFCIVGEKMIIKLD